MHMQSLNTKNGKKSYFQVLKEEFLFVCFLF